MLNVYANAWMFLQRTTQELHVFGVLENNDLYDDNTAYKSEYRMYTKPGIMPMLYGMNPDGWKAAVATRPAVY